jgi:hypothetical protein
MEEEAGKLRKKPRANLKISAHSLRLQSDPTAATNDAYNSTDYLLLSTVTPDFNAQLDVMVRDVDCSLLTNRGSRSDGGFIAV